MSRWKKPVLAALAVILLICGGMFVRQATALLSAHCVARVSFTGLNSLFHSPYEYYALDRNSAVQVPRFMIDLLHREALEREIFSDTNTSYWFVELEYAPDGQSFTTSDALSSAFGPKYRVVYNDWTQNSGNPDTDDLAVMRQAADTLHSGDPEDWVWEGDGARGLTSFILIRHEDHYLLQHEDTQLLSVSDDGAFRPMMDVPEGGTFDYFFFP